VRNFTLLGTAISALVLGSNAFTDAADGDAYVSALYSLIDADSDRDVSDGRGGYQLGAGLPSVKTGICRGL